MSNTLSIGYHLHLHAMIIMITEKRSSNDESNEDEFIFHKNIADAYYQTCVNIMCLLKYTCTYREAQARRIC